MSTFIPQYAKSTDPEVLAVIARNIEGRERFREAAAQYLAEFDPKAVPRRRPRHLRSQNRNDVAVDMLIGEMEFAGLVTSAPRHKAAQP